MATDQQISKWADMLATGRLRPETKPQAEATENWGGRRVQRESDLDALTPTSIKTLLLDAENGDIEAQCELFELMEERDGELAAHLRTRKAGVTRCDWSIVVDPKTPDRDVAAAEQSVALCEEVVAGMPGIQDAIFDALDATGKGFSVLEIMWQMSRAEWRPVDLRYRPQRWFALADDGRTLLIRGDVGADPAAMNPYNFIVHRSRAQSGFEWRTSLMRSCVRAFIVRHYSWKDWMALAEVYGMPPRIGILREGVAWDSAEARGLWAAVQALGQDYAAVIQGGNEINFPSAQHGEGAIYQAILEKAGRELTIAILGQTLTSGGEGGGSYALGEVHNQVRWDLIESDAKGLEHTMTEQFLRPIVRLNRGPNAPVPLWNIIVEKPENLQELAATIKTAVETGIHVSQRWAQERLGIPEPEPDEELIVPPAMAALATPVQAANNAVAGPLLNAGIDTGSVLNQGEAAAEPVVPEDGLAWLEERRVADEAAWEALSPAGRQRAWFVSGLSQESTARVADQLLRTFRSGETANEFLGRLEALDLAVPGGQTPEEGQISAAHARLVERQNRYSAYAADRWIKGQRTLAQRPYGQYHTAGDERVRPHHAALDGIVKLLTDPWWNKYAPPRKFGCRCTFTTLGPDELEMEGLAVADDAEEAARYQAALLLQDQVYGEAEFKEAVRRLKPEMARRENLEPLKAPANPDWTFDRNDAFGLESEGWAPRTDAGHRDAKMLNRLPRVGLDLRGSALQTPDLTSPREPQEGLPKLLSDLNGEQISEVHAVIAGLPGSKSSAAGAKNRQGLEKALTSKGWDAEQAHALLGAIDRWTAGSYDAIRRGTSQRAVDIQNRLQDLAVRGKDGTELHRGLNFQSPRERKAFLDAFGKGAKGEIPFLQSFSEDGRVAEGFAVSGSAGEYGVVLKLKSTGKPIPGLDLQKLSTLPSEKEIVTPAGLRYQATGQRKRKISGQDVIEITLELLP